MKSNTSKQDMIDYLVQHIIDPILLSHKSSMYLKKGMRWTKLRLDQLPDAKSVWDYYWHAIIGTEKSIKFSERVKREGFNNFEDFIPDFRNRF